MHPSIPLACRFGVNAPVAAAAALGAAVLLTPGVGMTQQVKPICAPQTRDCLTATARAYLDGFSSHDGSQIPFAIDVVKSDNGHENARGEGQLRAGFLRTQMIRAVRDMRFYVDEPRGEVVVFYIADTVRTGDGGKSSNRQVGQRKSASAAGSDITVHEAQRFRIEHGLITEIEAIGHVENVRNGPSIWSQR